MKVVGPDVRGTGSEKIIRRRQRTRAADRLVAGRSAFFWSPSVGPGGLARAPAGSYTGPYEPVRHHRRGRIDRRGDLAHQPLAGRRKPGRVGGTPQSVDRSGRIVPTRR